MSGPALSMGFGFGGASLPATDVPAPETGVVTDTYAAADAFDSLTIPFSSTTGNVLVRIGGLVNGSTAPSIACTWNGDAMTGAPVSAQDADGAFLAALFGISGGHVGSGNLIITCSGGSAGRGAVRAGTFATGGAVGASDNPYATAALFVEGTLAGLADGSNVATIAVASVAAMPFSSPDFELQRQIVEGTDCAVYFGQTPHLDYGNYAVFFSASSDAAMVIAEIEGVQP